MTHLLFLYNFGVPYYMAIRIFKYEKMSICVVLWCNVWVMSVRWERVKMKHSADISLFLSKNTKGTAWFNIIIRRMNLHQQFIFLHIILAVERFGFNLRIFGTEDIPTNSNPREKWKINTFPGIETETSGREAAPQRRTLLQL